MEMHFLILFCLCFVGVKGRSYASISPEDYWKSKLPTTSMPQSIKDALLLTPSGSGEVPLDTSANSLGSTNGYIGLLSYAKASTKDSLASTDGYRGLLSYAKASTKASVAANTNGYLSYAKTPLKDSLASANGYLSYAKTPLKDSLASANGYLSYAKTPLKDSLASANGYLSYAKTPLKDSLASANGYLSYAKTPIADSLASTNGYLSYAKTPTADSLANINGKQNKDSKSVSTTTSTMGDQVFFVEEDLKYGEKRNLVFNKGNKKSLFLPRQVSNKIPFSSEKLPQIYRILELDPKSHEAYVLKRRIELCEEPKVEGVEKKCLTSLESMIDFVISNIGNNVKALSTKLDKDYPKMEYTIHGVRKIAKNDHETVVCHKMGYPYALFFCHGTATIRSYMVTLVGVDGTKIEAIAACHKETSESLSEYMVNVLKVVPGSTRVCHFPGAGDNIIWVAV